MNDVWAAIDPTGALQRAGTPMFLLDSAGGMAFANLALGERFRLPASDVARWREVAAGPLHAPVDQPLGTVRRVQRRMRHDEALTTVVFVSLPDDSGRPLGTLGMLFESDGSVEEIPFAHSAKAPSAWDRFRDDARERYGFDHAPGRSLAGERLLHQCAAAAAERGPVAFVGPAGSGKLWWTRALHAKLAKPPPLAVFEPAALTVELQARFLFGDAESGLAGVLEPDRPLWLAVRQPTNLALDLQAKLVAAATAREDRLRLLVCERDSLESALRDGRLDPKLYYFATRRRIEVPPLVERREDLQDFCLIWHRLRSSNPHSGLEIDAKALAALASYHWPGNVRELFAVLDAARSRRPIGPISADDLVLRIVRRRTANPEPPTAPISLQAVLERVERRLLETALAQFGGNKSKAAEHLGLSRAKLLRRLEQLLGHKPGGAGDGENPDGKVDLKD